MDIQRIINLVKETQGIIRNREMAAHVREKGVADYVTQVDIAVQDFLKKALYTLAPDIQFLGEETGLQRMDTDSYWILDPVDGTTNLMHDYQHSVVSLALCRQKEIVMGIVYDPFHDEVFSAVKGGGSFLNGKTIHVASDKNLSETIIGIGTAKGNLPKITLQSSSKSMKSHKISGDLVLPLWSWHTLRAADKVDTSRLI